MSKTLQLVPLRDYHCVFDFVCNGIANIGFTKNKMEFYNRKEILVSFRIVQKLSSKRQSDMNMLNDTFETMLKDRSKSCPSKNFISIRNQIISYPFDFVSYPWI